MKVVLPIVVFMTTWLPEVISQQQALFIKRDAFENGKRVTRQTSADQMVQNILQWLQGVYTQNSRRIRQGSFREYLPPSNTQKPRPFEPPGQQPGDGDNFIGYPPSGSITPQPPFEIGTKPPQQPGYPTLNPDITPPDQRPGFPGYPTSRPDRPSTGFPGFPSGYPTSTPQPGYPGSSTGYPGPSTAYPGPSTGFPGPSTGYPGPSTGYPGPSTGYPGPSTGYPGPSTGYPGPSTGYPGGSSTGYPSQTTPGYPGPSTSYPTPPPVTGYPGPGYPGPSTGYPTQPSPTGYPTPPPVTGYPGPGYPGSSTGYPGPSTGYPGPSTGYPGPSTGYPGPSTGYPGPSTGYPGPSTGYPGSSTAQPPVTGYPTGPTTGYPTQPPPTGYPGTSGRPTIPSRPPPGYTSTYPSVTRPPPTGYPEGTTRPPYTPEPSYTSRPQTDDNNVIPTRRPGGDSEPGGTDTDEDLKHPPHIHAIDVECAKDMMTINIEFNRRFDGVIYSKGFYSNPECRYVKENSGQTKYSFTVSLNSCGTEFINGFDTEGKSYLENVLVLQNEPGIQEVWDTIRSVRCLWEGNLNKALSVALSVGMLSQEIVTFSGDTAMARLDIQLGKGPFAPPANGLVKIGEVMTLVVSVTGDPGFDIQVKDCRAKDSTGDHVVALTDDNGCILKPKLFGAFQKTRNTGNSGASIIAYAFFNAFKFPDVMDLMLECNVELCKTDCEVCPDPNQKLEPGRRRRDVSYSNETIGESVTVGKLLRVILPEDLSDGKAVLALSANDGVCMSTHGFVFTSAILISLLTCSCLFSAYLWLKNQQLSFKK